MPQIYGFSPKVNTRSLLFQHINQNIQYKEQIKMKQIISNGRKSSLNQSQRERTREKNWLRTPEVTPSSSQCWLPPHYPSQPLCSSHLLPGLVGYLHARSPLTCVFSGMGDERTWDSKGFSTGVTHVRLLPGVATHVVGERAGLSKALPAAIAHVGLLTTVLPGNKQTSVVCWHKGKSPSLLSDFPQVSSAFSSQWCSVN